MSYIPDHESSNFNFILQYYDVPERSDELGCEEIKTVFNVMASSMETIKSFVSKVPGFSELEKQDQDFLYLSSCLELFALRFAYQ